MAVLIEPRVEVARAGDGWAIRIPKLLVNFNSSNRSPHWSIKNRERRAWQALIATGVVMAVGVAEAQRALGPKSGLPGARGACTGRRRVTIVRLVPSRRNFIRDEFDNLRWSTKELRDALTQLQLIHDDSTKWCDMSIEQAVSVDGLPWTSLLIEPVEAS